MSHGPPSATTTRHYTVATGDNGNVSLPKGSHVEPMGVAADQDGFNSHHIVIKHKGEWLTVRRDDLEL